MSLFLTFEGTEGCGKSTQVRVLAERLRAFGRSVTLVREPGGTSLGEGIRDLLLAHRETSPVALAEAHLFAASRSQLVSQRIRPALLAGEVILCDRFVDSSLAYQGFGRGLGFDEVLKINEAAIAGLWPDRTFLLDHPVDSGAKRLANRAQDRIESEAPQFHEAVRQGFAEVAARFPNRVLVLNADKSIDEIAQEIWSEVKKLLDAKQ